MSDMKYVVFNGNNGEEIIIFPRRIQHSDFAEQVAKLSFCSMRPISGGFIVNGECVGESISLRMKSRGDKDTELVIKMLDLDVETLESTTPSNPHFPSKTKPSINKNKAKRDRKKRANKGE